MFSFQTERVCMLMRGCMRACGWQMRDRTFNERVERERRRNDDGKDTDGWTVERIEEGVRYRRERFLAFPLVVLDREFFSSKSLGSISFSVIE